MEHCSTLEVVIYFLFPPKGIYHVHAKIFFLLEQRKMGNSFQNCTTVSRHSIYVDMALHTLLILEGEGKEAKTFALVP